MFILSIAVVIMLPRTNLTNKAIVLFSCTIQYKNATVFLVAGVGGRLYNYPQADHGSWLLNFLLETGQLRTQGFYAFALFNMRNLTSCLSRDLTWLCKSVKGNAFGKPVFFSMRKLH
jgi:hypothetical protein